MATKIASRATQKYDRNKLVKDLKYTATMVETTIKSYDEAVAKWKEEAPRIFSEWVENWTPSGWNTTPRNIMEPPKRNNACEDWRIQRINRSITRLETMVDDVVALRADDLIFDDIQLGACL